MYWTYSGTIEKSRRKRYTIQTPSFEGGTWATDQLSQVYERIEDFFITQQRRARQAVMSRSRVDTGIMRSNVESFLSTSRDELVLEFGWWYGQPLWAIFQEFGTRTGIRPMHAVQQTFHEVILELRRVL